MQRIKEAYNIEVNDQQLLRAWLNFKAIIFEKLSILFTLAILFRLAFPNDWWEHEGKFLLLVLAGSLILLFHVLDALYIYFSSKRVAILVSESGFTVKIEGCETEEVRTFTSLKTLTKYKNPTTSQLIIDLHWEGGFLRLGSPINNGHTLILLKQIEDFTGLKAERKVFERKRRQYGYPYTSKPEE